MDYLTLKAKINEWTSELVDLLPSIVLALSIILLFAVLARYNRKLIKAISRKLDGNKTIAGLVGATGSILIVLIGLILALRVLNLDSVVASVLAGAGIAGIALGFAFQDIASNFIAGVIISIKHPFRVGDFIKTNDQLGTVEHVDLRMTQLRSLEGRKVVIPNKMILLNPLVDYTSSGEARIEIEVGVSYGEELDKVKKTAKQAIESIDFINKDKPVECYFREFGASSINLDVYYWIDYATMPNYYEAQSVGIQRIKEAFDKAGITIPFPIRTLDFETKNGKSLNKVIKSKK